jgi:cysteinyl-tRNA synthetase
MVKKLSNIEGSDHESSIRGKKMVTKIKTDFEKNMNNNLQVKAAFDSLNKTVSSLVNLKINKKLSHNDSKEALKKIREIDYVLQTIF